MVRGYEAVRPHKHKSRINICRCRSRTHGVALLPTFVSHNEISSNKVLQGTNLPLTGPQKYFSPREFR